MLLYVAFELSYPVYELLLKIFLLSIISKLSPDIFIYHEVIYHYEYIFITLYDEAA